MLGAAFTHMMATLLLVAPLSAHAVYGTAFDAYFAGAVLKIQAVFPVMRIGPLTHGQRMADDK